MNKEELVNRVYEDIGSNLNSNISKVDMSTIVQSVFEVIGDALKDENDGKFSLVSFGSFQTKDQAERVGRNPKTGEPITISARKVVKFSASKSLKEKLNS